MIGIKDIEFKILQELDDGDLGKVSSANKQLYFLCNDETFWMNRTIKKFGVILGDVEKIREYKNKYIQTNNENKRNIWKSYYISLLAFIDNLYSTCNFYSDFKVKYLEHPENSDFEDRKLIAQYISDKTNQTEDNICEKLYDQDNPFIETSWIEEPFVDISEVFFSLTSECDKGILLGLLEELLCKYNFKLNTVIVSDITCVMGKEGLDLILKKRNLEYVPLKDLNLVIYEYRNDERNLELILKYMSKEDILYSLFSTLTNLVGYYTTPIINEAIRKGATTTEIIKSMSIIPASEEDPDIRKCYEECIEVLQDTLKHMGLSAEDKKLLKEVTMKRLEDAPLSLSDNEDLCFDIFKKI